MRRLVLLLVVGAAACGPPSIETLCEEASANQCSVCYSCDLDGANLCQLADGTSEEECEVEMTQRCVDQAATLERPKDAIQVCNDSFDALTCEVLVDAMAQGSTNTTNECSYLL